jgi:transposase
MTKGERDRLWAIRAAAEGRLSTKEAAERLGVSKRQVRRLVARHSELGDKVAIHGLRGRAGNRGRDFRESGFRDVVLELARDRYDDYGPVLLAEVLEEREGLLVPRETLRRWLIEAGLRRAGRGRHRHPRRQRRSRFGELLQLDGSEHAWFEGRGHGGREPVLILTIDDATGRSSGRFHAGETTHAVQDVMRRWIERHGRPGAFYVDRASHFAGRTDEDKGDTRENTQVGRMLTELGVGLLLARSPQAKGRVERAFGTHQDRLVKKLRERGIRTIEEANEYLETEYWPEHNARFARPPANQEDAHRPLTLKQRSRVDEICSVREERTVTQGELIKLNGRVLQLRISGRQGPRPRSKIQVYVLANGEIRLRYRGRLIHFTDVTGQYEAEAPVRTRQAQLGAKRQRLLKTLERNGITTSPQGQSLESLSLTELEKLRPTARPAAAHPWRQRALPPRRVG